MTLPPNIRLQVPVPFPATVTGSGPITISKQNGIWTVGYTTANLAVTVPPSTSQPTDYVLVWDSVAKTFLNVPLSALTNQATLLNTMTANNSLTLVDTTSFPLGYNEYDIVFENVVPATGSAGFQFTVQSGGTFQTSGYLNSAGAATAFVDLIQAANLSAVAGHGYSGSVKLFGKPNVTGTAKFFRGSGTYFISGPGVASATCCGFWNSVAAITGLTFQMSNGAMTSGTIKIYGLF